MTYKKDAGLGFGAGLVLSIALTVLYIKFGYTLPDWLQPDEKIKSFAITTTADLTASETDKKELQRLVASTFSQSPDTFIAFDDSLGMFVTEEYLWQEKISRRLQQLLVTTKTMQDLMPQYPALKKPMQRVFKRLTFDSEYEKQLVQEYLRQRFPNLEPDALFQTLNKISLAELLHTSYPSAKFAFSLGKTSNVRIEIYDQQNNKINTLVNATLPQGNYRMHWLYKDTENHTVDSKQMYRFDLFISNEKIRSTPIQRPANLFS